MSNLIENHNIRNRFIGDYNFPFNIIQNPYFCYFIELFNEDFNCKQYLEYLNVVLQDCEKEEDFFQISSNLINGIINEVSSSEVYQKFLNEDLSLFDVNISFSKSKDIYIESNDNKEFISIDLKEANFNSMKYYSSDLFNSFGKPNSFIDLIKSRTNYEYFINSKKIRQIIFGNLCPKRQTRIQKWLIYNIVSQLPKCDIITVSHDEIIISKNSLDMESLLKTKDDFKVPVHIKSFKLNKIENHPYFLKIYDDGKIEFKKVPCYLMPQVYKKVKNLGINEYDITFYYEKHLVKFINPIF